VDEIRIAFWDAYRYLFPPRAVAGQTGSGGLMISWPLRGDPYARFAHATPIAIRFEEDLIAAMRAAAPDQRGKIAKRHEATLRAGLVGYDPYTTVPKARVIVLG
jgi:hypothetical protein